VAAAAAVPAPDMGVDCLQAENILSCYAVKASVALNRAARSAEVQVYDGITFVRETPLERSGKSMPQSEKQVMSELPEDATERAMKVSSMVYDSAVNFLKSHSLKVDPEGPVARAIESKVSEEDLKFFEAFDTSNWRAKVKKYLPTIYKLAALKIFAIAPIIFGGLALLVLKALVIGKVALLVAGVLAFQKLMGSGSGLPSFFGKQQPATGWTDPAQQSWPQATNAQNGNGYYRRSFEQDAHNLAYNAHAPTTAQTA
jgi:hypothetical protein